MTRNRQPSEFSQVITRGVEIVGAVPAGFDRERAISVTYVRG